jgi:hypothetical protein
MAGKPPGLLISSHQILNIPEYIYSDTKTQLLVNTVSPSFASAFVFPPHDGTQKVEWRFTPECCRNVPPMTGSVPY